MYIPRSLSYKCSLSLLLLTCALIATIAVVSCSSKDQPAPVFRPNPSAPDMTLGRLQEWLVGTFSSEDQAKADSSYYDVRIHCVPVWQERSDAHWLYVEQAVANALDRPYRQRVYRLSQIDDTTFCSENFKLPDPLRFVGEWEKDVPLIRLRPDMLERCEGCVVYLHPDGDSAFAGGTVGDSCFSDLRGGSRVVSESRITARSIIIWDRGYDDAGRQVWGSEKGAYVFKRVGEQGSNNDL